MEKKIYDTPTMDIVELEQNCQILDGSNGKGGTQNYIWNSPIDE